MNLNSELQTFRTENMKLKQQLLNTQMTKQCFDGTDKKVLYMTGFPSYMTVWYYRATSAWRCHVKFVNISQVYPCVH